MGIWEEEKELWKQHEQAGSPTICTLSAPDPGRSEKGRCPEEEESTGEVLRAGGAVGAWDKHS